MLEVTQLRENEEKFTKVEAPEVMHVDEKYLKALEDVYKMEEEFDNFFSDPIPGKQERQPKESPTEVAESLNPDSILDDIRNELDDIDKIFEGLNVKEEKVEGHSNPQDNL